MSVLLVAGLILLCSVCGASLTVVPLTATRCRRLWLSASHTIAPATIVIDRGIVGRGHTDNERDVSFINPHIQSYRTLESRT